MIHVLMGRLREEFVEIDNDGEGNGGDQRALVIDEDRCAVNLQFFSPWHRTDTSTDNVT